VDESSPEEVNVVDEATGVPGTSAPSAEDNVDEGTRQIELAAAVLLVGVGSFSDPRGMQVCSSTPSFVHVLAFALASRQTSAQHPSGHTQATLICMLELHSVGKRPTPLVALLPIGSRHIYSVL
jgi:hypothetical protein